VNKNMKNDEELEKRILELEIEWGSLSQEQRKLLAYRKIIDLRLQEIDEKDKTQERKEEYKKEFMAIAEASDLSGLDGTFPRITVPKVIQNREQYQEALVSLWKVLENYKNLAGELKIDKALELSHLFYYMLYNKDGDMMRLRNVKNKQQIMELSKERIKQELDGILISPNFKKGLNLLNELGIPFRK